MVEPITTALVAGASFLLKGLASEVVKDAYEGLKSLLVGRLSSLPNLEEDPADEDYAKATSKELQKKGLAEDPDVLAKARTLTEAIEKEPADKLAAGSIDISGLRAAQGVIVKRLHAAGNIAIRDITTTEGKIQVEDLSSGGARSGGARKN